MVFGGVADGPASGIITRPAWSGKFWYRKNPGGDFSSFEKIFLGIFYDQNFLSVFFLHLNFFGAGNFGIQNISRPENFPDEMF